MQTKLEELVGLKRRLTVVLSLEEVAAAYEKYLRKIAKDIKMPGFRPGKVPLDIIERKHAANVKSEVAVDLMQQSFKKFQQEQNIVIAGQPHVHPSEISKDQPFEYHVDFEVYPEIQLKNLEGIEIDKLVAEVTDGDVDTMLTNIQRQHADWTEVERAAAVSDRLLIDFVGTKETAEGKKETFKGSTAKDFSLELGSKRMISGFEEGLVGAKPKEMRTLKLRFPKDYPVEDLADKNAEFEVTVHKIEEPALPQLTDDFVDKLNIKGGIDGLKSRVRVDMNHELQQRIQGQLKMRVLDELVKRNPIDIPEALVDIEIDNLQRSAKQQMARQQGSDTLPEIDLPREPYIDQARQRVTLGLLLSEAIKLFDISVDGAEVRKKVEEIAAAYHNPQEIIEWYYKNKSMLNEVEALVIEDRAVAKLLEQVTIKEQASSYDEVIHLNLSKE